MNARSKKFLQSAGRIILGVLFFFAVLLAGFGLWTPGLDVLDGRHDRGSNAVWIAHGWLGSDEWFIKNQKTNDFEHYRNPVSIRQLAAKFRQHRITDVFPHLCPAEPDGHLPGVNPEQVERFLDVFDGFRVMPWIGGPNGPRVRMRDMKWRAAFVENARKLLEQHPRFAGVQLNIEPIASGDESFLVLLEELHGSMPAGKILSIAAYPPPTRWHPFPDLHWDEAYFRQVAKRSDQLAVMMYDASQKVPKTYQQLMVDWTQEVLNWSEGKPVLLGVPTYDDAGVEYHYSQVENITNALLGIHRSLSQRTLPANYQGIAIYCDWETSDSEWNYFRDHFLKSP